MILDIFRVILYLVIVGLSIKMIRKLYPIWNYYKPDIVNALVFILFGNALYFGLIAFARINLWYVSIPQTVATSFLTIPAILVCGATVLTYRILMRYYKMPPKINEDNTPELLQR